MVKQLDEVLGFFIVISTIATQCNNVIEHQKLKGVEIFHKMEGVDSLGNLHQLSSTYSIFYYDNLEMYKYLYEIDSSDNETIYMRENREAYLIFHKDSSYGYQIEKLKNGFTNKRVEVSFIVKSIRIKANLLEFLKLKPQKSLFDSTSQVLRETYNFPATKYNPGGYSVNLFFTKKLQQFPESFFPQLDSMKGMKLFRVETKYHEGFDDAFKINVPAHMSVFEMKEASDEVLKEATTVLDQYSTATKQQSKDKSN